MPSIHQSFLALYTFPSLTYIIFLALSYRAATVYYYLVLIVDPFVFAALTPYLKAAYIILNLNKSCLGTALKIQRLPI